jgi:inner membrane transporter RhtA
MTVAELPTGHDRAVGAGLVVVSCIAIQGSAAASTGLFAELGPVGVAAWRQLMGAVVLLLVLRPTVRGRRTSAWLLVVGLGGSMAAMNTTYYLAVDRLPLGVAAALLYVGPFVVAVAGIRRRHLLIWPCLALAGVLAITRPDQAAGISAPGIGFGLLAATSLAAYTLASHRLGAEAAVADLALAVTFSALLLTPFAVTHIPDLSPRTLGTLALVGSLGVALAFACDFLALRLAGTTVVGTLFALDPVVGALLGLGLLGQGLPLEAALGVAAVSVAGIGLSSRAPQG